MNFLFEKRLQIREYICAIYKLVKENSSLLNDIKENSLSDAELLGTLLTNDDLFEDFADGICEPEKSNKLRKIFLKRRDKIKRQASEINFLFPTNLYFLKDIIKVYFDLLSAIMKRNIYIHSIHESYSNIPVSQRKTPEQMRNECENLQTNRDIIKYRDQLTALLQQSPLPNTLKLIDETVENG